MRRLRRSSFVVPRPLRSPEPCRVSFASGTGRESRRWRIRATPGLCALLAALCLLRPPAAAAQTPAATPPADGPRATLNVSPVFSAAGIAEDDMAGGVLSAGGILEWIAAGGLGLRLDGEAYFDTDGATGFGAGGTWQFARSASRVWYLSGGFAGIHDRDDDRFYSGGFGAIGIVWKPRRLGLRGELRTIVLEGLLLVELRAGLNLQLL